jgi:hypothetical protein
MDHSVLAKGGGPNEVEDWFSVDGETGLSITDHHTPIHIDPEEVTQVALL